MEIAPLASLAAEPASILYIVTGVVGLLFARLRVSRKQGRSSVFMLFSKKSTREKLSQLSLT
jgi:hypothetical protein